MGRNEFLSAAVKSDIMLMNAVAGLRWPLLMYSGKRAYWGNGVMIRRIDDRWICWLLRCEAQRQHAMTALQIRGTSKWGIILFGGRQGGSKLGDSQSHIGKS